MIWHRHPIQEASITTRKKMLSWTQLSHYILVLCIGRWPVYHCGNTRITTFLEWKYLAKKDKQSCSKVIKMLKNKGNDEKSAPQARQKIGYFGVFFRFLVFIPPLVNDKSETRGGINTRNTISGNPGNYTPPLCPSPDIWQRGGYSCTVSIRSGILADFADFPHYTACQNTIFSSRLRRDFLLYIHAKYRKFPRAYGAFDGYSRKTVLRRRQEIFGAFRNQYR